MNTLAQLRAGQLTGIQRLSLSCGLQAFPPEIFELADSLEILDLSGNALSSLPDDLPRLHKLRVLFCSNNQFSELPAVLGQCAQLSMVGFKANQIRSVPDPSLPAALRWLILTDNQIEALPASIGHCTQLQKLMLAGNRLSALPVELAACHQLELLRISANRLTELPTWLLELPRLAWLAYGGNPFCTPREAAALTATPLASIAWDGLQREHLLGEGASGVIYQARWQSEIGPQAVALKLFKGAVTSDGLPQSEISACLHAGRHAQLIPVLGQVLDHPSGARSMVMSLIDPVFRNLAGPPSLASCTRDVYPQAARFDLGTLLRLARGIASAARHLHAQGLMHGDLYAHNILHNGQGAALLGDFGAASFLSLQDQGEAQALQRLEVRAFACLLEELLARCDAPEQAPAIVASLHALKVACFQVETGARPLFSEVEQGLTDLQASLARVREEELLATNLVAGNHALPRG